MTDKLKYGRTMRINISPEEVEELTQTGQVLKTKTRAIAAPRVLPSSSDGMVVHKKKAHEKTHYKELLQAVYDAVLVTDMSGKIVDANVRATDFLRYTEEELCHLCAINVISGADASLLSQIRQNLLGERFTLIQAYCVRKDGSSFPAEIAVNELHYAEGGELAFFVRDVTERHKAQEAIKRANERFELAASAINSAIYDWDITSDIMLWTDGVTEVFGYELGEIDPTPEWRVERIHPDDRQPVLDQIAQDIDKGVDFEAEYRFRTNAGEYLYVWDRGRVVRNTEGHSSRMVGCISDITERKRHEQELRAMAEELRRSNRDLQQFAYVASHDLQEPLRMVASFVQLLERRVKDQIPEEAREWINFAVDGVKRMQGLINDLLQYSRVGTRGKEFEQVDLNAVLEYVTTNLQAAIEEHKAQVTHDELPTVLGDKVQLGQLFQNLVGNAIKFHGEKPPEVHVSAEQRDGKWLFAVRDNGIGIDPEYADRIFVIFQRLHTREEYAGTGIGLAICKKIVERHGGEIRVESDPGKGATFRFTLDAKGNTES